MEALYDTELMLGGGHVKGWRLTDEQMSRAAAALNALKTPEVMAEKYGMVGAAPLLFAVGDGNHSLATAKGLLRKSEKGDAGGAVGVSARPVRAGGGGEPS